MPGRHRRIPTDPFSAGSAPTYVPVSVRAARVAVAIGLPGSELVNLISEEETDGAHSITWLSLEYIVLQISRLPPGYVRVAGTLEVFFDFLILVGGIRMSWSPSAVGHHCRDSLIYLATRVDETGSRSLIPRLAREIMIIIFLASTDPNAR